MKKILFTLAAVMAFIAADAQNTVTEKWPNGNKKSEGIVLGEAKIASGDSKEVQARKMANVTKDGKWSTWYENGTLRSEEYYNKGAMVGSWKTLYDNGKTEAELNFTTGKAVYFFQNGQKNSEGGIANGMISTGKWVGYHENGNKNYEGAYNAQGQKDGVWMWYNTQGIATTEQTYKAGELLNTKDLSKK